MSKRERYILIVTLSVVGVLALDYFVYTPLTDARDRLLTQHDKLSRELGEMQKKITASQKADKRWKEYRAAGLSSDPSATESRFLNAIGSWSRDSGLPLLSIRPERTIVNQGVHELSFHATADGSMRAISRFLYRLETSEIPVRIQELQISSRTDGSDDLTMQIRLSTIWEERKIAAATTGKKPAEVQR